MPASSCSGKSCEKSGIRAGKRAWMRPAASTSPSSAASPPPASARRWSSSATTPGSPYVPCEALSAGRLLDQWYPTDVNSGAMHLPRLKALRADDPLTQFLLDDHEDNLFLHGWGMANEPIYNPQATVYLLRDDPKAAIRDFYSGMACAFSHSVFEPVEHRWTWGQFFGPPSTDGTWFELFRNMLIQERDDDTLLLLSATPRRWLEDGKRISVQRAADLLWRAVDDDGKPRGGRPDCRRGGHARAAAAQGAADPFSPPGAAADPLGDGQRRRPGRDFDADKEWIRIPAPEAKRYTVTAQY